MDGNPLSFKFVRKTWDLIQTVIAGWNLHNCSSCVVFPVRCGQKPPKLVNEGNWWQRHGQRRLINSRRKQKPDWVVWSPEALWVEGKSADAVWGFGSILLENLSPATKQKKAYRCFERHTNYSPNTQFLQISVQLSICWRILTDKSAPGKPHLT